jgi:YggT family protein
MTPLAAIDRNDVAVYVEALFYVMIILIIARIAMSWYISFRGAIPYITPLRAVTGFIEETVDPYLNLFRRRLPPVGGGGLSLDLSPMIGLIVLGIAQAIIVGLIRG